MNRQTAARLLDLNKQFYQTFGREFSSTRQRLQPGVLKALEWLAGGESILDLGCGNGGVWRELDSRGFAGRYLGLDFSVPLLEAAQAGEPGTQATFRQVDLTAPDWSKEVSGPFDRIFAFAILHHIPGVEFRRSLLAQARSLLKPNGWLVHSEWQFMNSEKLLGRIQPWSEVGLPEGELDPGDSLLDWRAGGTGLRYVHAFDDAELADLAAASGFHVRESFLSDGENGRLGLYQVWELAGPA